MTAEPTAPPESRLEAYTQNTWSAVTKFSSFDEYHIHNMKRCVEDSWQLLEYMILCILVHHKRRPIQDVYEYLKAYPWTKDTPIAKNLSCSELHYSWHNVVLAGEAEPAGCGSPDALLRTVDEGQIHRLNTQFRYWQGAGERSWEEHFVDMSPHMWFGPQGQERQRRLGIPDFSDGEGDEE